MIKEQKVLKLNPQEMQLSQDDNEQLKRSRENPLYFYNMYIRKEGEPVLNEEQYKQHIRRELALRLGRKPKQEIEFTDGFKIKSIEARIDLINNAKDEMLKAVGISEDKFGKDIESTKTYMVGIDPYGNAHKDGVVTVSKLDYNKNGDLIAEYKVAQDEYDNTIRKLNKLKEEKQDGTNDNR